MFARANRIAARARQAAATATARRFNDDEGGAIAIIFALSIFVVFLVTGLAIDVGRVMHANAAIGSALDAASLAGAKALRLQNLSDTEVKNLAEKVFKSNMTGSGAAYADVKSMAVNIDRNKSAVGIDIQADVKMVFGQIAGIEKIAFPNQSMAIYEAKDIEIALQLDVTGSMCDDPRRQPCATGRKIDALKAAVGDLIDIVIPSEPTAQKVRVALAPFSAGVNAGAYARAINGNRSAPTNCVYERLTPSYQSSDAGPSGQAALKIKSDLTGSSIQDCPPATVVPLMGDKPNEKQTLKSIVGSYKAQGSTAGHLGSSFAYYMLSPSWNGVWNLATPIAPYKDGKTDKVAILMTDGEYNTVGGRQTSTNTPVSQQYARDICAAMRDGASRGIIVYTIGFEITDPGADAVLSSCAGVASRYKKAASASQLRSVFREIAEDISTLRLSR